MSTRLPRLLAAAAVTLASGTMTAAPAAAAGIAGYCPDSNGVTVVVDFQGLGGGTVIRCAAGEQATGLAALKNAGFTVTGTSRWGEAFICRINGKPGADTEPCINTPPATAYWSYWHAANGGGWTYSSLGVLNRKPPLGSFEGWSFSLNRTEATAPQPRVAPSRPASPAPPPPTTTGGGAGPPPAANPGAAQPAATSAAPVQSAPTTAAASGSVASATSASATNASATSAAVASGSATSASASEPTPAAQTTQPGPSIADIATRPVSLRHVPTGTLVGGGLLLALAAAGGIAGWLRRRRAADGG
jgi:hypothetical protein